jgi:hypothetical protein
LQAVRLLPYGNHLEKPYHLWGWLSAAVVGLALTLLQFVQPSLKAFALTPFACAVMYWIGYEIAFNKPVFGKWNYVGKTATWDKRFWRWFGRNTETFVVILKAVSLLILNALYLFL